jgi:hypothetical protein
VTWWSFQPKLPPTPTTSGIPEVLAFSHSASHDLLCTPSLMSPRLFSPSVFPPLPNPPKSVSTLFSSASAPRSIRSESLLRSFDVAFTAAANPLTENNLALTRHPRRQVGLDNGDRSWRGRSIPMDGYLMKVANRGPRRYKRRGPVLAPTFHDD